MTLDIHRIRQDFPILDQKIHGNTLVYLDNAATSQKPNSVIQAITEYYSKYNANIHRGVHKLSEDATLMYEESRQKIQRFIGARKSQEIVFVRNTTEAINLVAFTWGQQHIKAGDEILLTEMEHHSNMVPWQILAQDKGASLRYLPISPEGELIVDDLDVLLTEKTRLLAITQMSNVLGTINPIKEIVNKAHSIGAKVLVDGAQSVPHMPVDVQELNCDFLAFSGHKMLGPTGIGVLYAKEEILQEMPPYQGGGDMIRDVTWETSTWNDLPWRFEAGTPNIADVIGLGRAVDYLNTLGMEQVLAYEHELAKYAVDQLRDIEGLTIYGPMDKPRGGLISFTLDGIHPHDIASILDQQGIAIRAGHHCAQPLTEKLGAIATARASFYIYTTKDEINQLCDSILLAKKVFHL